MDTYHRDSSGWNDKGTDTTASQGLCQSTRSTKQQTQEIMYLQGLLLPAKRQTATPRATCMATYSPAFYMSGSKDYNPEGVCQHAGVCRYTCLCHARYFSKMF